MPTEPTLSDPFAWCVQHEADIYCHPDGVEVVVCHKGGMARALRPTLAESVDALRQEALPIPEPLSLKPICSLGVRPDGAVICIIAPTEYSAGAWGILLADLARHVALDHERRFGAPPNKTIAEIRALFTAEMERPTDFPKRIEENGHAD